jgi:hypothetical protein
MIHDPQPERINFRRHEPMTHFAKSVVGFLVATVVVLWILVISLH